MRFISRLIATFTLVVATVSAITAPECQDIAPPQPTLNVRSGNLTVYGAPFGLLYASEDVAFVAIGKTLGVLNTSTFTPTLAHRIQLPPSVNGSGFTVGGLALSSDKSLLYVSTGPGAFVLDAEKAAAGSNDSIVGLLSGSIGLGAIQVTLSADSDYAFVSQEYGEKDTTALHGAIEVFRVYRHENGSVSGQEIGYAELGYAVVGSILSPDGKRLYVTSEIAATSNRSSDTGGTLSVLDAQNLTTNPSEAVIATVDAGCAPVRLAISHNGDILWVTARESNKLIAFSTSRLVLNASDAILASVQVGTSPIGVAIVNNGRHIITADSNRFGYANASAGLTVVDTVAALEGKQDFPRIPTGKFPREFAVSPDGKTLLVAQYGSRAVQSVDLEDLVEVAGNCSYGTASPAAGFWGPHHSHEAHTGSWGPRQSHTWF